MPSRNLRPCFIEVVGFIYFYVFIFFCTVQPVLLTCGAHYYKDYSLWVKYFKNIFLKKCSMWLFQMKTSLCYLLFAVFWFQISCIVSIGFRCDVKWPRSCFSDEKMYVFPQHKIPFLINKISHNSLMIIPKSLGWIISGLVWGYLSALY